MRTIQIISGFEPTGTQRTVIHQGYSSPEQVLFDLEVAGQAILANLSLAQKPVIPPLGEVDATKIIEAINQENNQ